MKYEIDTETNTIISTVNGEVKKEALYSKDGFETLSDLWVKVGWNERYSYTFSWMGRPIIQLPEDVLRMQEVIYRIQPDVIIETGVAHGGSIIFYASLCKVLGRGRVIGIDIEIREHNRKSIEEHELFSYIQLVEGSSTDENIVNQVKGQIKPGESVLVILDSNHTKQHVLDELEAYHSIVSVGSYIVATDGIMKDLHDVPNGRVEWKDNNPSGAAIEFADKNSDFVLEVPKAVFNESKLNKNITHWPNAWLKRIK
ncbi:cephalosporin hydroxylase family protein [Cohnella yongneupensis]|uniref:Cephalosporin hydroxylase family protein n=1 Tax=Cohnella yongneupensis TaxID=425006 RepID=A0ABW0QZE1_9BACL